MYKDDKIWNDSKQVARAHGFSGNWVDVIDYYNAEGGTNVQIYCVIEEIRSRILYVLDSNKVLLMHRNNELHVEDYDIVMESQKVFFYKEDAELQQLELPEGNTYYNETQVTIAI